MLKRILIGGVFAIVVAGLFIVLIFKKGDLKQYAAIADAVPANAIVFVDRADYAFFAEEQTSVNALWSELKVLPEISEIDTLKTLLSRKLEGMPVLRDCMREEGISFSLHLLGKDKLSALFYVPLGEKYSEQEIKNEIVSQLGRDAILNDRKYEAVELTDVSLANTSLVRSFSFAVKDGLLIVSTSSLQVENAIRTLHSGGGISNCKGFKIVESTAGKYVHANIYLNYRYLDNIFYPVIKPGAQKSILPLSEVADWGEFDLDMQDNILVLNGMTYSGDSIPGLLGLLSDQDPVRHEASECVPSNATAYTALGLSNVKSFQHQLIQLMELRGESGAFKSEEKKYNQILAVSPLSELLGMLNGEIIRFTINNNLPGEFDELIAIRIRSKSETLSVLEGWVSRFAGENNHDPASFMDRFKLDDQTSFTIYDFPEPLYRGTILEAYFKKSFAVFDNYVFFADSHEAISRTIYQNVLHKTLANEGYYEETSHLISSKSNLTVYIKPGAFLEQIAPNMTDFATGSVKKLDNTLQKISGLVIQFSSEDNIFYGSIGLKYSSTIREKALTVWESLLDTVAITKPVLVVNHNTSEKEIFVQDANYSAYLLNGTGRVLWKIKLDGPILSDIIQVDYYRNGKLQYLFSTPQSIHLIDRNGNNVERYPVKLRSDATNGVVLFDYDNTRDYRMFIACDDRKVYAYDLEGNIVPGWDFRKSEGKVTKPVQHFRIKDKDYIIFSDEIRPYILDRRGKERVKLKDRVAVSGQNIFYLDMNISGDGPRFISTDTSGTVVGINLDGVVSSILPYKASPGHLFRLKDMDRDGKPDCLFANENLLDVVDLKGKRLFSYKLKDDISTLPDIYEFSSSDLKIGLVDPDKNLIYLLNSDGSLYEGFPLEGSGRFSIGYFAGSDSRFNLIVGSQNGFLYNYSIE